MLAETTYEIVKSLLNGDFPQAKQYNCYVITRQDLLNENGITFYNGNIKALVSKLKSESGKNIYCDGGAEIVKLFMQQNLIDEYTISIIPTILGDGKRLFKGGVNAINLKLQSSKQFESGLVQLRYYKDEIK